MLKWCIVLLLAGVSAQAQHRIIWPQNKKAAIVLTYDDGLASQLKVALPQLKAAHLKATFYLTADVDNSSIPHWRNAARLGYELGNHTLYHPCTCNIADNPVTSDQYTVSQMIDEIDLMNHLLFAIDGRTVRTFAYPCAETTVGSVDYADSLGDEDFAKYARCGGNQFAVVTDADHLDPVRVPSYGVEDGTTAEQLIAFVKRVQESGGMGVFMFHGIGGDYITVSAKAHQQLVDYLARHEHEIWVPTFLDALDYISAQKHSHGAYITRINPARRYLRNYKAVHRGAVHGISWRHST